MALQPFSSKQYQKRTAVGSSGDECCVCGRDTRGQEGAIHVPINHERCEFVTNEQAKASPEACIQTPGLPADQTTR